MPPTPGHPIWIQIPATSVPRAQAFYTALFPAWTLTPKTTTDGREMCSISFSPIQSPQSSSPSSAPAPTISAGIVKVDHVIRVENEGASMVVFYVEGMQEMLRKVKEAGGEVTRGVYPEGEGAEVAQWRDTEGNVHAFFARKEAKA